MFNRIVSMKRVCCRNRHGRGGVVQTLEGRTLLSGLTPDEAFGAGGQTMIDVFGRTDMVTAVVVQADGKIVAGGSAATSDPSRDRTGIIVRLNPDGSRDATFADNGLLVSDTLDDVYSIALDGSGRILAGGSHWDGDNINGGKSAIARYNADGSVDTTFGPGGLGYNSVEMGSWAETVHRIAIASDGKIVGLSGAKSVVGFDQGDFGINRFNTDGSIDTSFGGGDGIVTTDFSSAEHSEDHANALVFTADGKIVVGGMTSDHGGDNLNPRDGGFALARYNNDGSLDATFGDAGMVFTPFAVGPDFGWQTWGTGRLNELLATADGKLLGIGSSSLGKLTVVRYNADGSIDSSYGTAGIIHITNLDVSSSQRWSAVATVNGGIKAATAGALAAVAELDANGALVESAGSLTPRGYSAYSVPAFQPDGKLLIIGSNSNVERPLFDNVDWIATIDLLVSRYNVFTPEPPVAQPSPEHPVIDVTQPISQPVPAPTPPIEVTPISMPTIVDESDGQGIDIQLKARDVVRSGRNYRFKAVYTSDETIDRTNFGGMVVSSENGFNENADVIRAKLSKGGTKLTVTYRVDAPGGRFDLADNGTYSIYATSASGTLSPAAIETADVKTALDSFHVVARGSGKLTPADFPPGSTFEARHDNREYTFRYDDSGTLIAVETVDLEK